VLVELVQVATQLRLLLVATQFFQLLLPLAVVAVALVLTAWELTVDPVVVVHT
jgi:hypothetical protein